ncbi:MAG: terpene cyclase/mutase family protein [Candidatus Thorarchaeota archaeon]|nr:terpene cyclase/mutase family protein [Candidatus Thorarchaeota archaeon]
MPTQSTCNTYPFTTQAGLPSRSASNRMKKMQLLTVIISLTIILSWSLPANQGTPYTAVDVMNSTNTESDPFSIAATSGIPAVMGKYAVIQFSEQSIPSRGADILQVLEQEGVVAGLYEVTDILLDSSPLNDAIGIVIDGSLGSENGTTVSNTLIDILVRLDKPVLLLGRSAWIFHRLRDGGLPLFTAPGSKQVYTSSEFPGAVFLSMPYSISDGATLTAETIDLPIDIIQTESSRLIDITNGEVSTGLAPLRYDSWPLDTFLLSIEDPTQWTTAGYQFFMNTLAFASSLGETTTAETVSQNQANGVLSGGLEYFHEPTISSAYDAVHAMLSILDPTSWSSWASEREPMILSLLSSIYVDTGSESSFMEFESGGAISLRTTAKGLWLVEILDLTAYFSTSELVTYLSSRQAADGSFDNNLKTTYYVTEALSEASSLNSVNQVMLENWLRDCVITGSDTSNPDLWGGIGVSPTATLPQNSYAYFYLNALDFMGLAHDDPVKLSNWILTRTSNGDGSFDNSLMAGAEVTLGTASALISLEILGSLSSSNRTNGLNWLSLNQLSSGGFGLGAASFDLLGKTEETSFVGRCLSVLGVSSGALVDGISLFIDSTESPLGFEGMESAPSLMWTDWLGEVLRFSHGARYIDTSAIKSYFNLFDSWAHYPEWNNLTAYVSPEYGWDQYRTKGVWTQYFGISACDSFGIIPSGYILGKTVSYLDQSQYFTGHYRPTYISGTAHMQNSVAAIETLYMIDSLDTISYRPSLESAVLSEYSAGVWDNSGWTLQPFAESQPAIDWLSTRAALRLGLIDSTMASEIASVIIGRVQYDDLWALSRDVATLALLNSSFPIDLESFDSSQILASLGASPFSNGWFNNTLLWQPVYTAGVMEMISILGLRPHLYDTKGSSLESIVSPTVGVGSSMDIHVTITSPILTHSVFVYAFDEWTRFDDVSNVDTLSLDVPNDYSVLGPVNVSIMVWDYNSSRSFDMCSTQVEGSLTGSIGLDLSTVLIGDQINGTASWSLSSGGDAGNSQITIRLSNEIQYQEWYYVGASPFGFSVPTTDFESGPHNLSVTVETSYCNPLALQELVWIQAPDATHFVASDHLVGDVGTPLEIPWSLRFSGNDSYVSEQIVTLIVEDQSQQMVFSDTMISAESEQQFLWTPTDRGIYTFILLFERNGTLERSSCNGTIDIYEDTEIIWQTSGLADQYNTILMTAYLSSESGNPLIGFSVSVLVTSPTDTIVYQSILVTNGTGHVSFYLLLSENGNYTLNATFAGSGLLIGSQANDIATSYSTSTLALHGISSDGLVNENWLVWIGLTDSMANPIANEEISLTIVFLPSTILLETTLTTNETGIASLQWMAPSPGSYQILAEFLGSASRQSGQDSITTNLRIPITLSVIGSSGYEVGIEGWSLVEALDHLGGGVSGLVVTFVVRNPLGDIVFQTTGSTNLGLLNISWIPISRGSNNLNLSCERTTFYESQQTLIQVDVFEQPSLSIEFLGTLIAPSSRSISIIALDSSQMPIVGVDIQYIILLDTVELYNDVGTTGAGGILNIPVSLDNPGSLQVIVGMNSQSWLFVTNNQSTLLLLGETQINIDYTGIPVNQGSTLGFQTLIVDWESSPLAGADVYFSVETSNGSIIASGLRTTGVDGTSAFAHTFLDVGDYVVRAVYTGYGFNASCSDQVLQRIVVTPALNLVNSPTCLVGGTTEIWIGMKDALEEWMVGYTLNLTLTIDGFTVFQTNTLSVNGLELIHWTPSQRGVVTIRLDYAGSTFILTNSTQSFLSSLEQIAGSLTILPSIIDLGNTTTLVFQLSDTSELSDVDILFEVLDIDLVPLWSSIGTTNSSGIATVSFVAVDIIGVLTIYAAPQDQLLIGGDSQGQLIVQTHCSVTSSLQPSPASLGGPLNITIECRDDLGGLIDGLSMRLSLYYLGQPIRLGLFTDSITVVTDNGFAIVEFTPEHSGSYQIVIDSAGSSGVHSFYYDVYHIVHNPTSIEFITIATDLEVGDDLHIVALLTNFFGDALEGRVLTLTLAGISGPTDLVTNTTGHVDWYITVNQEGLWSLSADFAGVGVYLPSSLSEDVDVRYGTQITVSRTDSSTIIAGLTPLNVSVLLQDTGGSPLEGRTVSYYVYHDSQGLLSEGSFVQIGQTAEMIEILLDRMGDYTILFSFEGTAHYHQSSTALSVFAMGTTSLSIIYEDSTDRSESTNISIILLDELGLILDPQLIQLELALDGASISLENRLLPTSSEIKLLLSGLRVGQFILDITMPSSSSRVGCSNSISFNVTTLSDIIVTDSELSGLLGQTHSVTLEVIDSLLEVIEDASIYVSIYDPTGAEIFGSLLTTRTLVPTTLGSANIDWTPSKTGNYTVFVEYEGNDFIQYRNLSLVVLSRYETNIDATLPERVTYPESGRLMVTLSGGIGKVTHVDVLIQLFIEGELVDELILATDARGLIQSDLSPPYAGNYTVLISYAGSLIYSECTNSIGFIVEPDLVIDISTGGPLYAGIAGTIIVSLDVLGAQTGWQGTLLANVVNPNGVVLTSQNYQVNANSSVEINIVPDMEGLYAISVELRGLPIIELGNASSDIMVNLAPPPIVLTNSDAPVVYGGAALGILGLLLRRRLSGSVDSLSVEWDA